MCLTSYGSFCCKNSSYVGGTFFEKLNATVHLQRGQMIIFRGKLRHRGVKITYGKRYLLVGFLVEQKPSALNRE